MFDPRSGRAVELLATFLYLPFVFLFSSVEYRCELALLSTYFCSLSMHAPTPLSNIIFFQCNRSNELLHVSMFVHFLDNTAKIIKKIYLVYCTKARLIPSGVDKHKRLHMMYEASIVTKIYLGRLTIVFSVYYPSESA